MRYLIDTDKGTCVPYDMPAKRTLADCFEEYEGTKEYNGVVAHIQRWYYGSLVKAAWCATAVSFFADQLGLDIQKAENVRVLMENADKSCQRIYNRELGDPTDFKIKRGDILFFLWEGDRMTTASSKHVGIAYYDCPANDSMVVTIGGNQDDSICVKSYDKRKLYAVYRPNYKEV